MRCARRAPQGRQGARAGGRLRQALQADGRCADLRRVRLQDAGRQLPRRLCRGQHEARDGQAGHRRDPQDVRVAEAGREVRQHADGARLRRPGRAAQPRREERRVLGRAGAQVQLPGPVNPAPPPSPEHCHDPDRQGRMPARLDTAEEAGDHAQHPHHVDRQRGAEAHHR